LAGHTGNCGRTANGRVAGSLDLRTLHHGTKQIALCEGPARPIPLQNGGARDRHP
jgi:hypothetical protein